MVCLCEFEIGFLSSVKVQKSLFNISKVHNLKCVSVYENMWMRSRRMAQP